MQLRSTLKLIIIFIAILYIRNVALAQDFPQGDPFIGGQLYDNWYVLLDLLPPEGDQPLWLTQDTNTRSGTVTWRCSICHGWDYKGADGAYGLGSAEYTGFPGIINVVGASNEEIFAWLDGANNPDHDFSQQLDRRALMNLTAFLRTKLVNIDLIIDSQDFTSLGKRSYGRVQFFLSCAKCHGNAGRAINLNTENQPEFIADVALSNPWRFVHKIRFGTPLVESHAFEQMDWNLQNIADTLAYSQALPPADPNAGVFNISDQNVNFAGQGDMNAIVIAAVLIVAVVLMGQAWTSYNNKS